MTRTRTSSKEGKKDIQALMARMNQVGSSGGAGYWSPKEGDHMIRVLPAVGEMDFFFQPVGQHRLPDGKWVTCPSFTTDGECECPLCELVNELYNTGHEDDRETAGKIRMQKRYFMNIVVRERNSEEEKKEPGSTGAGPHIFTPGVTIFQSMQTLVMDPEYGDISDDEEGVDLIIHREGTGLKTEYTVMARRNDCPLHVDEDKMDDWIDEATDLTPVMLTENPAEDNDLASDAPVRIMPYDRIISEFGVGPGMEAEDLEVADKPKEQKTQRSRGRRKVEGDEDPFPADDEKKTAAEPAKDEPDEVGKEITRQRRRRRR